MGGDWCEGLRLGEGRIAFVVGDVTGHGVTASADMPLVRGMITALLIDSLLDALLGDRPPTDDIAVLVVNHLR